MGLISVICPYCFAEVALDDSEDYGVCIGCGFRIEIEKPVEVCPPEPVPEKKPKEGVLPKVDHVDESEVLKDEMFSYFDSGNLAKAHEIVKKLLSMDSTDADAWYMDGVCTLDRSEYPLETGSIKDAVASFTRFTDLTGLEVNIDGEAFRRYLKDAGKGDLQAQRRVGVMYSRGMGVEQSQDKAMEWFRKAYGRGLKDVRSDISDALRMMDSSRYTVPSFVDEIWDGMFERSRFVSVTIPGSITRIGDRAFADCDKLESVDLPSNLKTIGKEAFYRCGSLRSVTIPESVTSIGPHAFYNHGMEKATVLSKRISDSRSLYMRPGEEIFSECTEVDWGLPEPAHVHTSPAPSYVPTPEPEDLPATEAVVDRTWIRVGMALTVMIPLIVLGMIWNEFYDDPILAMVLSVAPALSMLFRFNSGMLLIACAIDSFMITLGMVVGLVDGTFFALTLAVIIDLVAVIVMFLLAAVYPGRAKS